MPIFDFTCKDCGFTKEHFVKKVEGIKKACPSCGSEDYHRGMGNFRMEVEYRDNYEHKKYKQDRELSDIYARIGKEALDEDTKTLDNLFGSEKVKRTYHGSDYESRSPRSTDSEA